MSFQYITTDPGVNNRFLGMLHGESLSQMTCTSVIPLCTAWTRDSAQIATGHYVGAFSCRRSCLRTAACPIGLRYNQLVNRVLPVLSIACHGPILGGQKSGGLA